MHWRCLKTFGSCSQLPLQEKISSGILSLQKRCGFIVDLDEGSEGTGSSQEEQNKALHSGNLSFDEVVKKVGGAAFNPLAGRITHKRHLSASSILTPQGLPCPAFLKKINYFMAMGL